MVIRVVVALGTRTGSAGRLGLLCLLTVLIAFAAGAYQRAPANRGKAPSDVVEVPVGINKRLWRRRIPPNNRMNAAKVALGEALYFDKRLSPTAP